MKKKPIQFRKLGLEMFSIVFAVLLALALDSWQENNKKSNKLNQVLEDIVMELNTFTFLDKAIEYNLVMLDTVRSKIKQHEDGKAVEFQGGLGRPEIKSLAWTTAKTTGLASEIDRSLLLELAEIYSEFDRLENILESFAEFNLKRDPDMSEYTRARYVERYMRSAIFRMQELSKKSKAFIEKHKNASFVRAIA